VWEFGVGSKGAGHDAKGELLETQLSSRRDAFKWPRVYGAARWPRPKPRPPQAPYHDKTLLGPNGSSQSYLMQDKHL
jgi:hypothetical protein